MELEEAKKILMGLPEYQDLVSKEFEAIDTVISELVALQELLDEKKEEIEEFEKQYISKDKIKEKIENLKSENWVKGTRTAGKSVKYWKLVGAINVLQELLESEG